MVRDKNGMIKEIKEYFYALDMKNIRKNKVNYRYTEYGVFSPSDMSFIKKLFDKVKLSNYRSFVDIGSGDGRVVIIASEYTKSTGIEIDPKLYKIAQDAKHDLKTYCTFINKDFNSVDLSVYDFIFISPDTKFSSEFSEKLEKVKGTICVISPIFLPNISNKKKESFVMDGFFVNLYT